MSLCSVLFGICLGVGAMNWSYSKNGAILFKVFSSDGNLIDTLEQIFMQSVCYKKRGKKES